MCFDADRERGKGKKKGKTILVPSLSNSIEGWCRVFDGKGSPGPGSFWSNEPKYLIHRFHIHFLFPGRTLNSLNEN